MASVRRRQRRRECSSNRFSITLVACHRVSAAPRSSRLRQSKSTDSSHRQGGQRCRKSRVSLNSQSSAIVFSDQIDRRHGRSGQLISPCILSQQSQNHFYKDNGRAIALDYAPAVNAEIKDLFAVPAPICADRSSPIHAGASSSSPAESRSGLSDALSTGRGCHRHQRHVNDGSSLRLRCRASASTCEPRVFHSLPAIASCVKRSF